MHVKYHLLHCPILASVALQKILTHRQQLTQVVANGELTSSLLKTNKQEAHLLHTKLAHRTRKEKLLNQENLLKKFNSKEEHVIINSVFWPGAGWSRFNVEHTSSRINMVQLYGNKKWLFKRSQVLGMSARHALPAIFGLQVWASLDQTIIRIADVVHVSSFYTFNFPFGAEQWLSSYPCNVADVYTYIAAHTVGLSRMLFCDVALHAVL